MHSLSEHCVTREGFSGAFVFQEEEDEEHEDSEEEEESEEEEDEEEELEAEDGADQGSEEDDCSFLIASFCRDFDRRQASAAWHECECVEREIFFGLVT